MRLNLPGVLLSAALLLVSCNTDSLFGVKDYRLGEFITTKEYYVNNDTSNNNFAKDDRCPGTLEAKFEVNGQTDEVSVKFPQRASSRKFNFYAGSPITIRAWCYDVAGQLLGFSKVAGKVASRVQPTPYLTGIVEGNGAAKSYQPDIVTLLDDQVFTHAE